MHRLYQWLSRRASFFRVEAPSRGTSRIVHTEVTVERRGMTVLVGGATVSGLDLCPLCGQKLAPEAAETARTRLSLQEGSTPSRDLPVDGTSP